MAHTLCTEIAALEAGQISERLTTDNPRHRAMMPRSTADVRSGPAAEAAVIAFRDVAEFEAWPDARVGLRVGV